MNNEPTSSLLDEVFEELDSLENTGNVPEPEKAGFLEDLAAAETEIVNDRKKRKKTGSESGERGKADKTNEIDESLIHEGLTDSSDDEENKYFENVKYNDCGKEVNQLLKQKEVSRRDFLAGKSVVEAECKKTASDSRVSAREQLLEKLDKLNSSGKRIDFVGRTEQIKNGDASKSADSLLVDPIFKMRIVNPLVSSVTLKQKMIDRLAVPPSKIKKFLESSISKTADWVTGGVVTSKIAKTSQKGNQYCIWNLTDLNGFEIKTVTIFLFGTAYRELWKTSVGTVVAILNPTVMADKSGERSEATLKVENVHRVMVVGTSKDYGICKSKKKNGENCSGVVNLSKCQFCVYHLDKEYRKACRRSDLQPPKIGNTVNNLQRKVLGRNQVFAGGKIFTGVRGKKSSRNVEKDDRRLKSLSDGNQVSVNDRKRSVSGFDSSDKLKGNEISLPPPNPFQSHVIDLNFSVTQEERSAAKMRALNYVRKYGPIKKSEEEDGERKRVEKVEAIKRKLEEAETVKSDKIRKIQNVETVEKKFERIGMTEKFFRLMNSGVKNVDLLKVAEAEQREKVFDRLETREKMEEKMASIFKVECNAVRCLKCNYKSFSAADLCKREKHPLKTVKATKRFWKCGKCTARTVSLELLPLHSCKNCGSSKWEKTSMIPERGPNLTAEPLSLRGFEEKFVGAVVKGANLNLLVPESTPVG